MRIICKGCGSTIDLYEGALDECPICDTTHNFKAPCAVLHDTFDDKNIRNTTDHKEADRLASIEAIF